MKLQKLPIGIQTFSEIINKNYLYIDKTNIAYNLITKESKYIFLSRPRRFGKSLFLDTLHNIFEGNKELFQGLDIYDKWDWEVKHPVIKISWDGDLQTLDSLKTIALDTFKFNQQRLGVQCDNTNDAGSCLRDLIVKSYQKYNQQVVILIDEYDRPILDTIDNIKQSRINREFIKGLYSILKGYDQYIKFVFLTGVSKFSKSSIFSGLNMLEDISLNKYYGNICGYTQNDVETTFLPYLKGVDLEKVKSWYNGYNFLEDDVYNPFDLLLFIKNEFKYSNYWFSTGTPTFLIKLIEKNNYFLPQLSNLTVDEKLLNSFDIDNIDLEVILYQAGYLTIDEMIIDEDLDLIEYKLKLPNKEVKSSLNDIILKQLYKEPNANIQKRSIIKALKTNNMDDLKLSIISMFASIPYNNYTKNDIQHYEGFYASIIYVYLQSLGVQITGEDVTNRGRIDLTVFIENSIYIIEFKVGYGDALQQIREKNYHQKYLNKNKDIYLIGINFDEQKKNISSFKWEKI